MRALLLIVLFMAGCATTPKPKPAPPGPTACELEQINAAEREWSKSGR